MPTVLINILLYTVGPVYLLWVLYVGGMNIYRCHKNKALSKTSFILSLPVLAIAGILDVLVNAILGTIVFGELPKELTLSARLTRYVTTMPDTKRGKVAAWVGSTLLDTFAPSGKHIG